MSCRVTLLLCFALMLASHASGQVPSFSQPKLYKTGLGPEQVAVADFNLDGKPDIAVLNAAGLGSFSILLGNGDGTFSAPLNTSLGTSAPKALLVADFNPVPRDADEAEKMGLEGDLPPPRQRLIQH